MKSETQFFFKKKQRVLLISRHEMNLRIDNIIQLTYVYLAVSRVYTMYEATSMGLVIQREHVPGAED
jgi:hypothetical protein